MPSPPSRLDHPCLRRERETTTHSFPQEKGSMKEKSMLLSLSLLPQHTVSGDTAWSKALQSKVAPNVIHNSHSGNPIKSPKCNPAANICADRGSGIASWLRDPLLLLRSSFPLLSAPGRFSAAVACTCRSSAPRGCHSCRARATSKQSARSVCCAIGSRPGCCCTATSARR